MGWERLAAAGELLRALFASLGVRKPCLRLLCPSADPVGGKGLSGLDFGDFERRRKHGLRTPRLANSARKSSRAHDQAFDHDGNSPTDLSIRMNFFNTLASCAAL
jgi:hypothetical protein